ncbi:Ankyrin repeat-containing protein [Priestia aryabhattai B8W22]|nr:Ankyrin repeat-containing protein [Priestia aryabhattai B8W22]
MGYIDQITNAAVKGKSEEIKALLNKEPSLLNAFNSDGWAPLPLACYFGQVDSAKLLLSLGADIHAKAKNPNDNMPLHAAVANKQIQAVDL